MKLSISSLLISAAIAAAASADPASDAHVDVTANILGNCADCTQADLHALDVIVSASANHYSKIAHVRLDNLMKEMSAASVTDGTEELPKEKALLIVAVQAKINDAKIACMPHALAPTIMTTIEAHADLHIPWSQKDQVEKKMADLNLLITDLVLDRIQADINAELLSKECAEKMTNTEIVPVPVAAPEIPPAPAPITEAPAPITEAPAPITEAPVPVTEAPAPIQEEPAPITDTPGPITEAPAPIQEAPAPVIEASTPVTEVPAPESPVECTQPCEDKPFTQVGIDVLADVDPKFVCKTGCKDSKDANVVLKLRVNLEKEFEPRLEHFYKQEVPTACNDERSSLLGGVLGLLSNLRVNVDAKAKAH
ncbi:hypothetical protein BG006_010573 [Podila minutissima]|uniref:Uncharacterized protein n=1 Tax=Podila minutissima TaxID=64525 RepID=A0A9P5SD40_9FUNG|nr:hypothetical protein BG006_010573 [Podila minutissima]